MVGRRRAGFVPFHPPLVESRLRPGERATARGFSVYLVPRPGGELVVGATSNELGYDTRVLVDLTAGVAEESTQRALREMAEAGVEVVRA